MKSILKEIKEQPSHIREMFMWLCVIIVFSVVGFVWFTSTAKQFVALVNPEQAAQDQALAQNSQPANGDNNQSPFATIALSFKGISASISELLGFVGNTNNFEIKNNQSETANNGVEIIEPQKLPLSKDK